MTAVTVGKGP